MIEQVGAHMQSNLLPSRASHVADGLTHTLWLGVVQLQNSRMVIQERDRLIKELEERVAFLEAEASTAGSLLFHGDQRVAPKSVGRFFDLVRGRLCNSGVCI